MMSDHWVLLIFTRETQLVGTYVLPSLVEAIACANKNGQHIQWEKLGESRYEGIGKSEYSGASLRFSIIGRDVDYYQGKFTDEQRQKAMDIIGELDRELVEDE
jgi:hypothetical protein